MRKGTKKLSSCKYNELVELLQNNKKLDDMFRDNYYEDRLFIQERIGESMNIKGARYYDHYCSFGYSLTDRNEFIRELNTDELNTDELKLYNDIYKLNDKYIDLYDKYNYQVEPNSNKVYKDLDKLDHKLDEMADELLQMLVDDLHTYEDYDEDDYYSWVCDNLDRYENLYVENGIVKEHIDFIKSYA